MTPEIKELMLAYLTAHDGDWDSLGCDVCRYPRDLIATKKWVRGSGGHSDFRDLRPDLCPDHGRELGVVW